jgi:hypothetical protein
MARNADCGWTRYRALNYLNSSEIPELALQSLIG